MVELAYFLKVGSKVMDERLAWCDWAILKTEEGYLLSVGCQGRYLGVRNGGGAWLVGGDDSDFSMVSAGHCDGRPTSHWVGSHLIHPAGMVAHQYGESAPWFEFSG